MKIVEVVECAYDGQMKQKGYIIEGDGDLSYWKMETTRFLMSPIDKSLYKSLIASVL